MTSADFAVLVTSPSTRGQPAVRHLYQHDIDALVCAATYAAAGVHAEPVVFSPALPQLRAGETWLVHNARGRVLYTFGDRSTAAAYAAQTGFAVLATPVRRAMPLQLGIPQIVVPREPSGPRESPASRGCAT